MRAIPNDIDSLGTNRYILNSYYLHIIQYCCYYYSILMV